MEVDRPVATIRQADAGTGAPSDFSSFNAQVRQAEGGQRLAAGVGGGGGAAPAVSTFFDVSRMVSQRDKERSQDVETDALAARQSHVSCCFSCSVCLLRPIDSPEFAALLCINLPMAQLTKKSCLHAQLRSLQNLPRMAPAPSFTTAGINVISSADQQQQQQQALDQQRTLSVACMPFDWVPKRGLRLVSTSPGHPVMAACEKLLRLDPVQGEGDSSIALLQI